MRVRVAYTEDVSDDYRRLINQYYGKPGLASRSDVVDWFRSYGESMNEHLAAQADEEAKRED